MNYLWGAVNAISAPYQYYKELPPLNPATLTGAIDVVVVRRPAPSGEGATELVCSPFHVRFGKWQVLRPAEKKVNITVNGKPVPFPMKIGDAGEAFFIFETEGDVPDDLITSPLLQPTQPVPAAPEDTGRFGAKEAPEPEFLDLNASAGTEPGPSAEVEEETKAEQQTPPAPSGIALAKPDSEPANEQESEGERDTLLGRTANFGKAVVKAVVEQEREKQAQLSDRVEAAENVASSMMYRSGVRTDGPTQNGIPEDTGDEALPQVREEDIRIPDILDNGDVVIDMSGYHSEQVGSRAQPSSEQAEPSSGVVPFPSTSRNTEAPTEHSAPPSPKLQIHAPSPPSSPRAVPFPRAPSEPLPGSPPRLHPSSSAPDEYSWEWGAFPQKSPMTAQFPNKHKHADIAELEGESDLSGPEGEKSEASGSPVDFQRSKSLPPMLDMEEEKGVVSEPEPEIEHEPKSDEEPLSEGEGPRSGQLEPRPAEGAGRTSWVRWWRRNKTRTQSVDDRRRNGPPEPTRPFLKPYNTEPVEVETLKRSKTLATGLASAELEQEPSASAPAVTPAAETPPEEISAAEEPKAGPGKKFAKTLRLTSDQLKSLDLQPGANTITFSLSTTGVVACTARIFVWESTDSIVISDIDGTITKSDALGHVFTMIGRDWTHLGVAKLYTDICRNGYKIMYLTSRAIGQADSTRYYLQGIKQNDYQLPEGPVIMSPDRLMASLHREVIMRKPEVFKMACLRDIQRLFGQTAPSPFYAGFGNRITDALSYRSVNVPSSRIFTIDSNGEVKMELLELAGYKSPSVASYIHMTDLVDQMFPPIQHKWETEFTDNNYWKTPLPEFPLPDLTPPSPALSARSESSNVSAFARLRNFSLRSSTPGSRSPPPAARGRQLVNDTDKDKESRLRQLSSLERLSSTLAGLALPSRSPSPQSSSATYFNSEGEDGDEDDLEGGKRGRRTRTRSMTSMPGSLPGSRASFSDDEDLEFGPGAGGDEDGDGDGDGGEYPHEEVSEEVAEQAFDEDLFAAGEMQNVPFL
ncbi:LNS2-domain-containing protein [Dentipellis sp. KUC8613]|nr:LNS2-domain-containing protein [Dentipellis sp. KUC8613]